MKKVLITNASYGMHSEKPMQMFQDAGFDVTWIKGATKQQILDHIADMDALLVGVEPADADVIAAGKKLQVISKHGVGIDNIDSAAAESRGILVKNAPGTNSDAVADYTFGLMLDAARGISAGDRALRNGQWARISGKSVWGKTIGIIGFGAIGRKLALRAKGFQMRVLAYDIFWNEEFATEHGIERATLEQIYQECDFISLHTALTPETKNMISLEQMKMMKPSAILINAARGSIVNEEDLYTALTTGLIAGAALDAFAVEPPPKETPLFELDNVVVTPHLGAFSEDAMTLMSIVATQNIIDNVSRG